MSVYRAGQKAEQLWRFLARRHKRRRKPTARRSRDTIKDRVSIHERPEEVNDRFEIGHWEGDLVICQRTRPVLVLHERKTRLTLAARLTGKGAAETASVIMAILRLLETSRSLRESEGARRTTPRSRCKRRGMAGQRPPGSGPMSVTNVPGRAMIRYALTRRKKLRPYIEHGFLEVDNNSAERSMKPVALGRKNSCSSARKTVENQRRFHTR